jgi:hypothetical protein
MSGITNPAQTGHFVGAMRNPICKFLKGEYGTRKKFGGTKVGCDPSTRDKKKRELETPSG